MPRLALVHAPAWLASTLVACAPTARFRVVVPENAAHVVSVPFKVAGGWILVRAVVDSDTASLVLDTGAEWTLVNRRWAKRAGARPYLSARQGKPLRFAPFDSADWAFLDTMKLDGGVLVVNHWLMLDSADAELRLREASGRPVEGVLGQEVLQQFAMEIDNDAQLLRLHDVRYYAYRGSGVIVPFVDSTRPIVEGFFFTNRGDSLKARLLLDTGASHDCLILRTSFVERQGLQRAWEPVVEGHPLISLEGPLQVLVGRAPRLRLGPLVIDSLTVTLGKDQRGLLADSTYDGIVGNRFLRNSRLVLDYQQRRVIVEPTALFRLDCGYDRSGVAFSADSTFKVFAVRSVLPHSPAADVGLRVGDRLVSLDDRPASDLDLEDIRRALMTDGAVRELSIARGADTSRVRLILRQLF